MTQEDYTREATEVAQASGLDDLVMDTGWHKVADVRVRMIVASGHPSELRNRWFEKMLVQNLENRAA